jgi:hypothetical protein
MNDKNQELTGGVAAEGVVTGTAAGRWESAQNQPIVAMN